MMQVSAAIFRRGNQILIAQRAADDDCGFMWELPGGKIEPGETIEQCIVREMKEELGIDIRVKDVYAKTIYHVGERSAEFTFFNTEIVDGEIQKNVHDDIRWETRERLLDYEYLPADADIIRRLVREGK